MFIKTKPQFNVSLPKIQHTRHSTDIASHTVVQLTL